MKSNIENEVEEIAMKKSERVKMWIKEHKQELAIVGGIAVVITAVWIMRRKGVSAGKVLGKVKGLFCPALGIVGALGAEEYHGEESTAGDVADSPPKYSEEYTRLCSKLAALNGARYETEKDIHDLKVRRGSAASTANMDFFSPEAREKAAQEVIRLDRWIADEEGKIPRYDAEIAEVTRALWAL